MDMPDIWVVPPCRPLQPDADTRARLAASDIDADEA
jgi:hypothetical protein